MMMESSVKEKVAELLLEVGAVKINPSNPFEWASGWKSPIYCDNRLTLSYPEVRSFIKDSLVQLIKATFPEAQGIAGVATAGIPQGALVADALNLPFLYVRSKAKRHGMANMIEGKMAENSKVVVIEDLVSTGGSSLKAVEALRTANYQVLSLAAIFSYGFPIAETNFKEANVPLHTLSNYSALINLALKQGIVSDKHLDSLNNWRKQPEIWGQ